MSAQKCSNCGRLGHNARTCVNLLGKSTQTMEPLAQPVAQPVASAARRYAVIRQGTQCSNCGRLGHNSRTCVNLLNGSCFARIQLDTRSKSYAIAAVVGCDCRMIFTWMNTGELPSGPLADRILIAAKELGIVHKLAGATPAGATPAGATPAS